MALSCNCRHGIIVTHPSNTASISICSMGVSGAVGVMSLRTRKCLRFLLGSTAVHLLSSNFLGLSGFLVLEGMTLKTAATTCKVPTARSKYLTWLLNLGRTFEIKITVGTKTATKKKLLIFKWHLGLLENHGVLLTAGILARPCRVIVSTTSANARHQYQYSSD